jgi:hydroxymethylpyrimidine pyrophosphatase-like HAD family hydrolase
MKFIPYSYSKIGTFKQCPYKFKLQYIDKVKIPFETNIALEKGKYIHSLIEHYIKGTKLENFNFSLSTEKDIKEYDNIFNELKIDGLFQALIANDGERFVEHGFGLKLKDGKLIPTNYKNGELVRGFIDFLKIKNEKAIIVDWKTGKFREDQDKLQVMIYAIWAFLNFPQIKEVVTIFYFVEHKKITSKTFKREDLPFLVKEFLTIIAKIEKCIEFNKNVSPLCNWCPMKKFGYCNGEYDLEKFKVNLETN